MNPAHHQSSEDAHAALGPLQNFSRMAGPEHGKPSAYAVGRQAITCQEHLGRFGHPSQSDSQSDSQTANTSASAQYRGAQPVAHIKSMPSISVDAALQQTQAKATAAASQPAACKADQSSAVQPSAAPARASPVNSIWLLTIADVARHRQAFKAAQHACAAFQHQRQWSAACKAPDAPLPDIIALSTEAEL